MCVESEIGCDLRLFRFRQHLEQCFAPGARDLTISHASVHDLRMADHLFLGRNCTKSATSPHSSEALFAFIRFIARLSSFKLQSASVSRDGGD